MYCISNLSFLSEPNWIPQKCDRADTIVTGRFVINSSSSRFLNFIQTSMKVRKDEIVQFVDLKSFCNQHPMGCPSKEEDILKKKRPRVRIFSLVKVTSRLSPERCYCRIRFYTYSKFEVVLEVALQWEALMTPVRSNLARRAHTHTDIGHTPDENSLISSAGTKVILINI